jgi:hypothetical protein
VWNVCMFAGRRRLRWGIVDDGDSCGLFWFIIELSRTATFRGKIKFCDVMKTSICHKYKNEQPRKTLHCDGFLSKNNSHNTENKPLRFFIYTPWSQLGAGSQSLWERVK